jgi:hypothetical protein
MLSALIAILQTARLSLRSRAAMQLEILALRHQLQVLQRSRRRRVRLTQADRLYWVWLARVWDQWRSAVVIIKPETVLAWHHRANPFTPTGPRWDFQ